MNTNKRLNVITEDLLEIIALASPLQKDNEKSRYLLPSTYSGKFNDINKFYHVLSIFIKCVRHYGIVYIINSTYYVKSNLLFYGKIYHIFLNKRTFFHETGIYFSDMISG